MEAIQKRIENLPATLESLTEFVLIGKQVLKAHKAKLAAIKAIDKSIAAQAAALEDTQDMAEVLLYAEAKMGEILAAIPKEKSRLRGSTKGTTVEKSLPTGINKKTSHYAQQMAKAADTGIIEKVVAKAREAGEVPVRKQVLTFAHVGHATGESEWYTPVEYIIAARIVMGGIECDPASSKIANKIVEAIKYYTAKDDGLTKKWGKTVWMNPPYAQPACSQFTSTLAKKFSEGEVKQACVLVNNATETAWFQEILSLSKAVCFIGGRVKFLDPQGKPGAPLQGQALLYFGTHIDKFRKEFQSFGIIMRSVT